jgi:hypothetical protein
VSPNTSVSSPPCVPLPVVAVLLEPLHQVNGEMPVLAILIVVLVAVGLGAAVGSASTYLVGAVVGVAVTLALLAAVGAIAAWRNPSGREDGAPTRRSIEG